jgi:hypothetical protein
MIWKLFKPNVEKLKEKRNINRLIKTLGDNDVELRRKATSALGEVGGEECVEPLIQLFADSDVELRRIAVSALGSIADEKAVVPLIYLLDDSDIELRKRVVSALGEIIKASSLSQNLCFSWVLGEIVAHVRAESAIGTICELIDHGSLKTLRFKKTLEESVPLDFKKKNCERCQKHSVHKYYVEKIRVFCSDEMVYNEEFGYIKCDNCGLTSKLCTSREEIEGIIIEPRTINKINSIIRDEELIRLPERASFIDLIQLMKEIEQSKRDKNLIDMVRRIKSQVIDGESNRCYYCGKEVNFTTGKRCSFCNLIVCLEHFLPEKHGCKGVNKPPVEVTECYSKGKRWYTYKPPEY